MKKFVSLILSVLFLWQFSFCGLCQQVSGAENKPVQKYDISKFDGGYHDYRFIVLNGKFQVRDKSRDGYKYVYVINTEDKKVSDKYLKKLNEKEIPDLKNINPELFNQYKHIMDLNHSSFKKHWVNYFNFINAYDIENLEPLNGLAYFSCFGEKFLNLMKKAIENGWWHEYCEAEGLADDSGNGAYTRKESRTLQRLALFLIMKKQGYSETDIKNGVNIIRDIKGAGYNYKLSVNNEIYKDFSKIDFDNIDETTEIKLNGIDLKRLITYLRNNNDDFLLWTKENLRVFDTIKDIDYLTDEQKTNILDNNFGEKIFALNTKYYHKKSTKVKKVVKSKKIDNDDKYKEIQDRLNITPYEFWFSAETGMLLLTPVMLPIGIVLLPFGIIAFIWFILEKGKYQ